MVGKSKIGTPFLLLTVLAAGLLSASPPQSPTAEEIRELRHYIKEGWTTLSRSNRDLPRALPDPKMRHGPGQPWTLYIPTGEDRARLQRELRGQLTTEEMKGVDLRNLPADLKDLKEPGLLYL